jgi:excisionase family DNA binding protein
MDKDYFSIEETADKLSVHSKTIRRYINSGKISAQKVAGSWRVSKEAINQYLNSCEENQCQHQSVSKDDFCIFMDSDYFTSDEVLQACTIVDYYVQNNEMKNLVADVIGVVAEHNLQNKRCRFNYVYDNVEHRVRFVFWGAPSFIEKVASVMKSYEKHN